MNTDEFLDLMVGAYVEAALWSSQLYDENGDVAEESLEGYEPSLAFYAQAAEDCAAFVEANQADLEGMDPEQAGHDFWLTRNGHGAGFWDRGLGERGDRLTKACKPYGEVNLWVNADEEVYAD